VGREGGETPGLRHPRFLCCRVCRAEPPQARRRTADAPPDRRCARCPGPPPAAWSAPGQLTGRQPVGASECRARLVQYRTAGRAHRPWPVACSNRAMPVPAPGAAGP
jgi:hypothetical protein